MLLQKLFLLIILLSGTISVFAQQPGRENAVELFNQKNYDGAVKILKKIVKEKSAVGEDWYYLGVSYLKKGDNKNAIKILQKGVEISPNDVAMHNALAFAYLFKNDLSEADDEARKSLGLNKNNADAYYISGAVSLRNGSYNSAYESAIKAIKVNPSFANAYLLKVNALISSFIKQEGTIIKNPNLRDQILSEALENLEIYLKMSPLNEQSNFYVEYLDSVKFFAQYYGKPENRRLTPAESETPPKTNGTPLNITSKPRASYTDSARKNGVSGTIILLVEFADSGKVGHILVLQSLGFGLDENAIKAARSIKFQPATKDEQAVSIVKQVQFSFSIY